MKNNLSDNQRSSVGIRVQRLVRLFALWVNAATADEGCTMVDARKLREYNHGLADENQRLRAENDRLRTVGARWRSAWRDELARRVKLQNLANNRLDHSQK